MSAHAGQEISFRLDRLDTKRLTQAFAVSILLHLLAWGGYEAGKKLGLWQHLHLPVWLQRVVQSVPDLSTAKTPPAQQNNEPPLVFVEVNPEKAMAQPPKNPKFYSDKNAVAENPEVVVESDIPQISGTQEFVPKTEDVSRNRFDRLMPSVRPEPEEAEEERPKDYTPGDLTLARPPDERDSADAERRRPRTMREVREQMAKMMPGQKMKQQGGVRRLRIVPSLDTAATPIGAYDAKFISTIQLHWYDLLDNFFGSYRQGKVVLEFQLNYDGRVTEVGVLDNTVSDTLAILCQKAIQDQSPYEPWSLEMRNIIGKDYRRITFTFYYN